MLNISLTTKNVLSLDEIVTRFDRLLSGCFICRNSSMHFLASRSIIYPGISKMAGEFSTY